MMLAIETYKLGIIWSIKITPLDQGYSRVVFGGRTVQECSTTNFSNKVYFVSEQQTGTFEAVYG